MYLGGRGQEDSIDTLSTFAHPRACRIEDCPTVTPAIIRTEDQRLIDRISTRGESEGESRGTLSNATEIYVLVLPCADPHKSNELVSTQHAITAYCHVDPGNALAALRLGTLRSSTVKAAVLHVAGTDGGNWRRFSRR